MSQLLGKRRSAPERCRRRSLQAGRWATRLTAWVAMLLFASFAAAAAEPASAGRPAGGQDEAQRPADAVFVGDTVIIASDGVELGLKDHVAVVLDAGAELHVTEVRGVWIGGYVLADGQRYTGWVHRGEVQLGGVDPDPVVPVDAPDSPDDAQTVAAVKRLGVHLVIDAAGNAVSADATESGIDGSDLVQFQGLQRLAVLDLSGRPITDQDVRALPASNALQELYLNDTQVGDQVLEHVAGMANLEILALANTEVTGATFGALAKLRALRVLNLSGCEVGDDDLRLLRAMPQLEVLVLSDTPITSDGLMHLASITKLRVLNLIGCKVDDVGLMHLQPLENLRMLYVEKTQITSEGVDALSETAPSLAIFH